MFIYVCVYVYVTVSSSCICVRPAVFAPNWVLFPFRYSLTFSLSVLLLRGTSNFRVKKKEYTFSPLSFAEVDTHAPRALSHPGVSACDCKRGTKGRTGVEGKGFYREIGFNLCRPVEHSRTDRVR